MSKRKKSDQTEWSDVDLKKLTLKDIKQLLVTREATDIPNTRAEMEQVLKTKSVEIDYSDEMTVKQFMPELRLRGLDDSNAKKDIILQRLRGEIAAPPKKKVKRAPKKKSLEPMELKYLFPCITNPLTKKKKMPIQSC